MLNHLALAFLVIGSTIRLSSQSPRYTDTGNDLLWTTGRRAERGFITSSSLEFIPAEQCVPTQIILKFKADFNISTGDKIVVGLSGFTSGKCDNIEGASITATFDEIKFVKSIVPGSLKIAPNSHFLGGYREGLVSTGPCLHIIYNICI